MRLKQSRLKTYQVRNRKVEKNSEGSTYDTFLDAISFTGEVWPASGKVQAEMYGERLSYIRNVRVNGMYVITTDRDGKEHYVYSNGVDISEHDGLCLYVPRESNPDYRVISIKPDRFLRLEAEKL